MKVFVSFALSFVVFFMTYSYAMSENDQIVANKIVEHILDDTDNGSDRSNLVEWYYLIVHSLDISDNELIKTRLSYVSEMLRSYIDMQKGEFLAPKQTVENQFWNDYSGYIQTNDIRLPERCWDYYSVIDDVAWAEDVPTSLLIATWQMESTCGFYFPANGDGPFQMLYKNVTGTMTLPIFVNELQDLTAFIGNKWNWYKNANTASGYAISLNYAHLNIEDLIKHGALYNGLSGASILGDIQPYNPDYVYGHYTDIYSGAVKDGLLVNVLKAIGQKPEGL